MVSYACAVGIVKRDLDAACIRATGKYTATGIQSDPTQKRLRRKRGRARQRHSINIDIRIHGVHEVQRVGRKTRIKGSTVKERNATWR